MIFSIFQPLGEALLRQLKHGVARLAEAAEDGNDAVTPAASQSCVSSQFSQIF